MFRGDEEFTYALMSICIPIVGILITCSIAAMYLRYSLGFEERSADFTMYSVDAGWKYPNFSDRSDVVSNSLISRSREFILIPVYVVGTDISENTF